jgi:hypothetical protein
MAVEKTLFFFFCFIFELFCNRYSLGGGVVLPVSLQAARQVQLRVVPESDEVTPVRKKTADFVKQIEEEIPEPEEVPAPEPEVAAESLEADMVEFVKKSTYFERILLFEPIPLLQLQDDLRAGKLKVSQQKLIAFLDSKGIDYLNPNSKWK